MTPSGTFGFYAGLSFLGWVFVIFCFPEAANMTLEEIRVVFEHGFGVRYAEEWRKQRKLDLQARREEVNVYKQLATDLFSCQRPLEVHLAQETFSRKFRYEIMKMVTQKAPGP